MVISKSVVGLVGWISPWIVQWCSFVLYMFMVRLVCESSLVRCFFIE